MDNPVMPGLCICRDKNRAPSLLGGNSPSPQTEGAATSGWWIHVEARHCHLQGPVPCSGHCVSPMKYLDAGFLDFLFFSVSLESQE